MKQDKELCECCKLPRKWLDRNNMCIFCTYPKKLNNSKEVEPSQLDINHMNKINNEFADAQNNLKNKRKV